MFMCDDEIRHKILLASHLVFVYSHKHIFNDCDYHTRIPTRIDLSIANNVYLLNSYIHGHV